MAYEKFLKNNWGSIIPYINPTNRGELITHLLLTRHLLSLSTSGSAASLSAIAARRTCPLQGVRCHPRVVRFPGVYPPWN